MAPATRTQKLSASASQASKNLDSQKKQDLEKDAKIAELEKIIEAQRLEIESLKKKDKENKCKLEKDAKKIEAAKKIIDNQKRQIIDQVVDRTGIEDIKAENERMRAEIERLKDEAARRQPREQLAAQPQRVYRLYGQRQPLQAFPDRLIPFGPPGIFRPARHVAVIRALQPFLDHIADENARQL